MAGHGECPSCGAELAYGDAPNTAVPRSPDMSEAERILRLTEQRSAPWVSTPETVRWEDLDSGPAPRGLDRLGRGRATARREAR